MFTHCGKHPSLDHHKRRASTASRFWYYRSHLSCDKVADSVNKTGPSLEIFFSGNKIRIMVQIRACVCGKKDRCSYSQTPKHTSRYAPLVHVWFLISIIICPVSSHFGYTAWDTLGNFALEKKLEDQVYIHHGLNPIYSQNLSTR